jgi:hypothetical protein
LGNIITGHRAKELIIKNICVLVQGYLEMNGELGSCLWRERRVGCLFHLRCCFVGLEKDGRLISFS